MLIILIHGFGCSRADWSGQLGSLAQVANVIAPDLSESGKNKGDAGPAAGCSIEEMADAVNKIRRIAAPTHTVLVGHSMGCRVALEAARRAPEAVVGIVLIEGSLRAVGDPDEAVRRHRARPAAENMALLKNDFAGMFSAATPEAFRKLVLQRIEEMDSKFAARLMENMTRWDAADAADALHAARMPILAIQSTCKEPEVGRRPINVGEVSPWLRLIGEQAAGRAEIIRLAGLGHFPQVEKPEVVNALVGTFIERLRLVEHYRDRGNFPACNV